MREWQKFIRKEPLKIGLISVVGLLGLVYLLTRPTQTEEITESEGAFYSEESLMESDRPKEETRQFIDLKGAVIRPGMYEIKAGQRLIEIVETAGGFTEEADPQQVNFAQMLVDQMVVVVPKLGDHSPNQMGSQDQIGLEVKDGRVNINQADVKELQSLNGIGAKKAEEIIQYREKNGLYQSIEELGKVSGIGEKTLESLKESITIK